jgi:phosphate/sulfate permease
VGDIAVIDDVGAMRQRQRGSEILFHQDDNIVTAWVITLPASALIAALYLLPGLFR